MIDLMTPIKCSIGSINLPNGDTHARPSMFVSIRTEGGTSGLSGLVPSVLPSRRRQDGGIPVSAAAKMAAVHTVATERGRWRVKRA